MRSHQLWREIERESGQALFTACGGLILARAAGKSRLHEQDDFFGNTVRAAVAFGIPHEQLTAAEIAARFPQFVLNGDEAGYFEPGAGYLAPEACVGAQLTLAARHGATLRFGETARTISRVDGRTTIETNRAKYSPGLTIVAAGPWLPQLCPELAASLSVRRQVLYWFERGAADARPHSYRPGDFPIFIWHWGEGADDVFYGFPEIGGAGAIKVATEQHEISTTPDAVSRVVTEPEIAAMHARHIEGRLRGIGGRCVKAVTCLYTDAPGANFIIDRLPDAPDTIIVSACSGHGFKHSAAIGEALAEMTTSKKTPFMLEPFGWQYIQS